jgi:hypothetical protein
MAKARGFETLMLKVEAKDKFRLAKAKIEKELGIELSHSNAIEIMSDQILSDSIKIRLSNVPDRVDESTNVPKIFKGQTNIYAAKSIVAATLGEEYLSIPQAVDDNAFVSAIELILGDLEKIEAKVIMLRFGFIFSYCTRAEAAKSLNLSIQKIASIEKFALRKLRHPKRSDVIRSLFLF